MTKDRVKACVSVVLILQQKDTILLSLRKNTGYQDGNWCGVGGHAESQETATDALCREAKEEIGIIIDPKDLQLVHVMYEFSNREYMHLFMRCTKWQGEIINNEPEKCGGLQFFSLDQLPTNCVPAMHSALEHIKQGILFSEWGWEKNIQQKTIEKNVHQNS